LTPLCRNNRRQFHVEGLALAPVVFGGLFVSLWTWKCFMMVVFQNKIIYMPGLPPNSRWEKIQDYGDRLCGIAWREERAKAADGTDLALCVADVELGGGLKLKREDSRSSVLPDRHFYVLYFQGTHIVSLFHFSNFPLRFLPLSVGYAMREVKLIHDQGMPRQYPRDSQICRLL
jgi:hypothetical protein